MKSSISVKILTMVILASSGVSFAAENAPAKHNMNKMNRMEMTSEQRQAMAASHEKMATCLRSEKSVDDCKMEMMNSCQENMGKESCSMMGEMDGMKGKMKHHKMMDDKEPSK